MIVYPFSTRTTCKSIYMYFWPYHKSSGNRTNKNFFKFDYTCTKIVINHLYQPFFWGGGGGLTRARFPRKVNSVFKEGIHLFGGNLCLNTGVSCDFLNVYTIKLFVSERFLLQMKYLICEFDFYSRWEVHRSSLSSELIHSIYLLTCRRSADWIATRKYMPF